MTTVNVIYQDRRNAALLTAKVELTGGYTVEHISLRLATTGKWGAVPDDFKVIRVLDVTGDAATDGAALLDAHAEHPRRRRPQAARHPRRPRAGRHPHRHRRRMDQQALRGRGRPAPRQGDRDRGEA